MNTTEKMPFEDLFVNAWLKYDKNITSVLRTMGFNSMKAFEKSNAQKHHYFLIMEDLKTDPNKGMLALHNAIQNAISSTKYKSLLWIEKNASRYKAFKEGGENVKQLASKVVKAIRKITEIPGVLNISLCGFKITNPQKGKIESAIVYRFKISIEYNPQLTISLKEQEPFTLQFDKPIKQTIEAEIPETILDLDHNDASVNDVLKLIFSKETFTNNFKFNGPCVYIPSTRTRDTQSVSYGCLGDLQEDYDEVVNNGSLETYVIFITKWLSLFTDNSNPYVRPENLISSRYNGNKLLGYNSEAAVEYIKSKRDVDKIENFCTVYSHLNHPGYRDHLNHPGYRDDQDLISNQALCDKCALITCRYNTKDKVQNSEEVIASSNETNSKEPNKLPESLNKTIEVICFMHKMLASEEIKHLPMPAQTACLLSDKKYVKDSADNQIYEDYSKLIKESNINSRLIEEFWKENYLKNE